MASNILKAPTPSAFIVYSGTSKETETCDCAARLYISCGLIFLSAKIQILRLLCRHNVVSFFYSFVVALHESDQFFLY